MKSQTHGPQGCSADLPGVGSYSSFRKKRTELNQLPTFKNQDTLYNIFFLASLKKLDDLTALAPF